MMSKEIRGGPPSGRIAPQRRRSLIIDISLFLDPEETVAIPSELRMATAMEVSLQRTLLPRTSVGRWTEPKHRLVAFADYFVCHRARDPVRLGLLAYAVRAERHEPGQVRGSGSAKLRGVWRCLRRWNDPTVTRFEVLPLHPARGSYPLSPHGRVLQSQSGPSRREIH